MGFGFGAWVGWSAIPAASSALRTRAARWGEVVHDQDGVCRASRARAREGRIAALGVDLGRHRVPADAPAVVAAEVVHPAWRWGVVAATLAILPRSCRKNAHRNAKITPRGQLLMAQRPGSVSFSANRERRRGKARP